MSDRKKVFDIAGFDPAILDVDQLKALSQAYLEQQTLDDADWKVDIAYQTQNSRILRLEPNDTERFPTLALKLAPSADIRHEYAVLSSIYDFGFHIGPRPFYVDEQVLIMEWVHGEPLQAPPPPDDEDKWHRMMAVMGVPNSLPFAEYASRIPMRGTAPHAPADLFHFIDEQLSQIDPNHETYSELAHLVERMKDQVAPQWNTLPPTTLNHFDPRLHHFIWEGYHMRLISWQNADWGDNAYAVGQLCAHPSYEEVPTSHWVWYRWELARLTKDELLIPRATTYTNLMLVYWAVRLTYMAASTSTPEVAARLTKQRDRYLKRAQRGFV